MSIRATEFGGYGRVRLARCRNMSSGRRGGGLGSGVPAMLIAVSRGLNIYWGGKKLGEWILWGHLCSNPEKVDLKLTRQWKRV